ncbi:MAG: S-layer protein [Oscillospiraceae bacterium]|nr:S-layer protein [Oscillospiraceae bacterium]
MKSKKFLSLLLAVALVFTALPATLLAEDVPAQDSGEPIQDSGKTQDGDDLPTLSIDVDGVTGSSATLAFTSDADGTVFYTLKLSDEQAPEEDAILGGETVAVTAGSPATVTVDGLSPQTSYTVYGLLENDAGDRSIVVSVSLSTEAGPPTTLMGAVAPGAGQDWFKANIEPGNIIIEKGTNSGTLKFTGYVGFDNMPSDTNIILTGSTTLYGVKVASGVTANITLDNLNIDLSTSGGCAFDLQGTANVTLTLADGTSNSLTSRNNCAGLQVPENATLTIGGTGNLTATGGKYSAGIGGGFCGSGGTITINSGTVKATGSEGGAGIGGGFCGSGGTITISGCTVDANGGDAAAGIGGGARSSGGAITISSGTVYISGGSVKATGQDGGADIGHGADNTSDETLMNKPDAEGGVNIYRTTLTLAPDTTVPETDIDFGGTAAGYGKKDIRTDDTGTLYFYLPTGNASAAYGGNFYTETVEAVHTNVFSLEGPITVTTTTVDNAAGPAGQAVNLFARVAGNGGSPINKGQVQFEVNGVPVGTTNVINGTAVLNWTIPSDCSIGYHLISAEYLGSGVYLPSSATGTLTINGVPTVTTGEASSMTASSAALSGNVTADGGTSVTARGFVYGTSANPTIGGAGVVQAASGSGTGAFTAVLSNLSDGTTYHVRAYATNSVGTSYGEDVTFTTLATPTVTTGIVSSMTASGAALSGNVTADGGTVVTARGFVYGTSVNPAIGGAGIVQAASGSGTGAFTAALSNLLDGTTYHVRAYATNSAGTSYGADVVFTTLATPTVTTGIVSSVTASGATLSGNITSDGGTVVTARGFVYGTSSNPAIGSAGVVQAASGSGTGAFTAALSNLLDGTTYHVRTYATNSVGTSYGADVVFTTQVDGSSDDSGSGDHTLTVTQSDKQPNQPVVTGFSVNPTVDSNGHATAAISQAAVLDAIAKALADAQAQGRTANGIGVSVNIALPNAAQSLSVTLSRDALKSLIDAGVRQLTINGRLVSLNLDLEAIREIFRQSAEDVTLTVKPVQNLSPTAKSLIGARPVYDITISCVRNGRTVNVTSLGKGKATLSIPYTPGANETASWLFGVYVDGSGQALHIFGSAYDANNKSMILWSNHFSVYGVGYMIPSEKYIDIRAHWAKESIDYVVGRGLLNGISGTAFSPDAAISRGALAAALGKQAGVDTKLFTTSSFSDVKAGSAFQPYIEWAYKKGIMQGSSGKFEPDRAVTREEIAAVFANYAKATGYTLPVTREIIIFTDNSSIGTGYIAAVKTMQQAGVMMGRSGNKLEPKSSVTRAEASAMLHRYIRLTIDPATAQGWTKNDSGQSMYCKNGQFLTGWQTIGGVNYYFSSTGVLQTTR